MRTWHRAVRVGQPASTPVGTKQNKSKAKQNTEMKQKSETAEYNTKKARRQKHRIVAKLRLVKDQLKGVQQELA